MSGNEVNEVAKSLSSIAELIEVHKAGKYSIVATLKEIDTTKKWYRNRCRKCSKRAGRKSDNLWYCSKEYCYASEVGSTERDIIFKVKFLIEDANGDKIFIVANDKVIEDEVGWPAAECLEILGEVDSRQIPLILTTLICREFIIELEVSRRFNVEMDTRCYKMISLYDYNEAIKTQKEACSQSTVTSGSAMSNDSHLNVIPCEYNVCSSSALGPNSGNEGEVTPVSKFPHKRVYSSIDATCETKPEESGPAISHK